MENTVAITFTLNGTVYTANGTKNHCYRWQEGLKGQRVRIKKDEFEAAEQQYNDECKARIEAEDEKRIEMMAWGIQEAIERENTGACTDEEIEAAIEEEAAKEIAVEVKKAKKRTRKSKDIAYEGYSVTLTAKQVDFIRHLPDTCFWENGLNSTPWTDVLAEEIGGQFAGKPMTTGAMISTICEKGLAERAKAKVNGKTATYMELTELGKLVAKDLGLAE